MKRRRSRRAASRALDAAPAPDRGTAPPDIAPEPRRVRYGPLVAALLGLAVYLPSLRGGWLYDDVPVIVANRALRDLTNLRDLVGADPTRPLLTATFALNHHVSGLTPWPYHLVNVVLHALNAALAARLLAWMAGRAGPGRPRAVALAGGALFAVTPMAAETVAYVSSRSTALAAAFTLGALLLGVRALEEPSPGRRAAALAMVTVGLLAKEEAAAMPLLLLLLDLWFVARHDVRDLWSRRLVHLPFLLLPLLGLAGRRVATGRWLPETPVPHGAYLFTQLAEFPGYLFRALVPLDPAFYRDVPLLGWPPGLFRGSLAVLGVLLLVGAWAARRRWPLPAFAVLWMAAGLSPASTILPLKETVVDHRAYVGGLGVAFLVGRVLARPGHGTLGAVLLALYAVRAVHYQWVLADPVRAWTDAVRHAPHSAEATGGLADAYAERNDPRAEETYRRATTLAPHDARPFANLGHFYVARWRLAEAETATRQAVALAPRDARWRANLARILIMQRRLPEAVAELETARGLRPPMPQVWFDLAELRLRRGQHEEARRLLAEAEALEHDEADARRLADLRARLP